MIRNLFEAVALIKAAPEKLKNFKELLNYARNIYKEATGAFPDGIDFLTLKNAAREVANIRDPNKVVKFPGGGKDKVSPFKERPGEFGMTILDDAGNPVKTTTGETPESLMKKLVEMTNQNLKDRGLGSIKLGDKIPPPKNKKPPVDPELKKSDDQKQLFMDFENRNKKGQLFNLSGQKGNFLTEDEFARELESNIMNFRQNSPGFNLQLIPELKKPGAKAYNPYPDKQGDKFLTDDQRQRVLSSLEKIMKNEQYQARFANNFADLMEEGDEVIEFAPDMFKIDPPKKADGGRIGFGSGSTSPVGVAGNQVELSQVQGPPVATGIMATPEGMTAEEFARANPTRQQILNPQGPAPQPPIRMQGPQMGGLNFLVPMDVGKKFPTSGGLNELRKLFGFFGAQDMGVGVDIPTSRGMITPAVSPRTGDLQVTARGRFKNGGKPKSPGRRNFIKFMAGLASLPVVGKLFKPAAKIADAAPVIQEGAKLGFENFMLLVDKIKRLGKSADNLATQERQKVIRYEGKDGSEYELVEDLTTGDISVTKDRPGVAVYGRGTDDVEGIDVIEDRSTFIYRKGEDVVDTKTGKSKRSPDEYEEVKQTSGDGEGFDGIDEIDDRAVNEVINELTDVAPIDDLTANQYMGTKNLRSKKASGGLAYMLGE